MASPTDVVITQAGKFANLNPRQLKTIIVLSEWYIINSPAGDPTVAQWITRVGEAQALPTMMGQLGWEESMSPTALKIMAAIFWQTAIQVANTGTAVANQTASNILLAAKYLQEMDAQTLERLHLYQLGKALSSF